MTTTDAVGVPLQTAVNWRGPAGAPSLSPPQSRQSGVSAPARPAHVLRPRPDCEMARTDSATDTAAHAFEAVLRPLWLRAQAGDETAYRDALGRIAERLRGYLRRRMQAAPDEVEDLVQEVLLALHLQRGSYDPRLPVSAWVLAIARHKLVDLWRRRGRDNYVSAPLDEVDVGRVKTGATVRVTFDAYPGKSFPGRVTRVADYVVDVREQNRTFEVEVKLDDASFASGLLPGTSADVVVVLARKDDALRVPAYAILPGGSVLVLEKGLLVSRKVETGLRGTEWAEVLSGLREGDAVVTSLDRSEVKEGVRARAEERP